MLGLLDTSHIVADVPMGTPRALTPVMVDKLLLMNLRLSLVIMRNF
jgi:hypothetical protein